MQIEQLKPIIEAALLAASHPLTVSQLGELFVEEDEVDRAQIAMALEALGEDCAHRGVELKEVGSGFRYQVKQSVHPWVSRMWSEKPSRYSRALLETLALIAYRQPITRPEIEQIRGVVVSSNIIKTMEEREWIRVVGHRDVPGRPALFGTTRGFLDYFNLRSLDELPALAEIRDMEDPQMRLDQDPLPPPVIKDLPIDPEAFAEEELAQAANDGGDDEDPALTESAAPAAADAAADETPDSATAQDEPAASPHSEDADADAPAVPHHPATADEAADDAEADNGSAQQDSEEYRA